MKKTIKKSGGARQGAGRPPGSKTVNRKVPRNTREKIAYFRTTQTAYLRLVEVSSSCNQTVSRFVGDMIEKHFEG